MYLIDKRIIAPRERVSITLLSGGYINATYSVRTKKKNFVVKIFRKEAFSGVDMPSRPERSMFEAHALSVIADKKIQFAPRVLFFDKEQFLGVLTHAPLHAVNYNAELLEGRFHFNVPFLVGLFSAQLHSRTFQDKQLRVEFHENPGYMDLRYGITLRMPMENNPHLKKELSRTLRKNFLNRVCLIHADTTPKNILVHGNDITVLDFELSQFGDPAQDVGIMIAHYFLLAIGKPQWSWAYLLCAHIYYETYINNINFTIYEKFFTNMKNNVAAMMLGRVDATVTFDYLEDRKEIVRKLAGFILKKDLSSMSELTGVVARVVLRFRTKNLHHLNARFGD